jgi:ribosomal protein L14E/L6E/L27E
MLANLVLSLCAIVALQTSGAPRPPAPHLIRVHVQTDDGGVAEELAARRQSVGHLAAAIAGQKKGKAFVIVDDEDTADVVIEVMHRGLTVPRVTIGLGTMGLRPGFRAPVMPTQLAQLYVTMAAPRAADPVEVTNKNRAQDSERGWKSAADDIAKQAEKWITEHRAAILKARVRVSPFR